MKTWTIEVSSHLQAPIEQVWQRVGTMEGVNAELSPGLRMSVPKKAEGLRIDDAPIDKVASPSWLLVFGFLPFDRHFLRFEKIDPPYGFLEESTSWQQKRWRHERTLSSLEGGTKIVDRVTFSPRLEFMGPIARRMVANIFAGRHKVLKSEFGEA